MVIAGVILPAVKHVLVHTKDKRVFAAIEIIESWCAGNDKADLDKARKLARAAADAAVAYAAYADAYAAYADAYAAAADARKRERDQQRLDIIAAFPPIN